MSKSEKKELSKKVEAYANKEFSYEKTISLWDNSLEKEIYKNKSSSKVCKVNIK